MGTQFNLVSLVAALAVASFVPGTWAQVKLDFCGSTEVPSLKCIINPGRMDVSIENRTVCFCVMIQGTVPTYNCMKADGRATIDDIRELAETIRNITSLFPIPTSSSSSSTSPFAFSSGRPNGVGSVNNVNSINYIDPAASSGEASNSPSGSEKQQVGQELPEASVSTSAPPKRPVGGTFFFKL